MASVGVHSQQAAPSARDKSKTAEPEAIIPDIIEERRKDAEGRVITNTFTRGKMLGKVKLIKLKFMHSPHLT